MSDIGGMVAELIAAGCAPEVAARIVAQAFVSGVASAPVRGQSADESADRRREKDRIRKQTERENLRISADVCGNPQMSKSSTIEDIKIDKKEKKRGSRLSADWTPGDEERAFAKQLGWSDAQIDSEGANFRDYWTSCAGAKGVKLDWLATWRQWIRNSRTKPAGTVMSLVVHSADTNWRPILDSYKRFKHWPKGHGNEPGMPGCRVPPELLKECGFPCQDPSANSPTIHPKSTIVAPLTFSAMPK